MKINLKFAKKDMCQKRHWKINEWQNLYFNKFI